MIVTLCAVYKPRTVFHILEQGQAFYTGKGKLNKFHPIVYGEDIAAFNAKENSAG